MLDIALATWTTVLASTRSRTDLPRRVAVCCVQKPLSQI